ncbi:Os11g0204100, partial [Oryza sativa Japonica Group]
NAVRVIPPNDDEKKPPWRGLRRLRRYAKRGSEGSLCGVVSVMAWVLGWGFVHRGLWCMKAVV